MNKAPLKRYFTEKEYLLINRKAELRSVLQDGEIYATSVAGGFHNMFNENLLGLF